MTRYGAVAAVVLLLSTSPGPLARVAAAPPPQIRQTVFVIVRVNPQDRRFIRRATTFHVGENFFWTAAHVIRSALPPDQQQQFPEWNYIQADEAGNPVPRLLGRLEVVCVDSRWVRVPEGTVRPHDSAVLRRAEPGGPAEALTLAVRRPAVGEMLHVWGFPQTRVLFEGRVTVVAVTEEWIHVQEALGAPSMGGHSGSPVLNSDGAVVGIWSGSQKGMQARGSVVPVTDVDNTCKRG